VTADWTPAGPGDPHTQAPATGTSILAGEPVSLFDVMTLGLKHRRLVLVVPVIAGALALLVTFLMPNVFQATARVLPPQQSQSTAALIVGQLAGLAGLGPGGLGIKNPGDLYVGMLKTRTVADALIGRFQLQKVYGTSTMVQTRRELAANSQIYSGKDSLITIDVEDTDAERAAAIANAYVEELQSLTQTLAVTEAAQRRLFFERQLAEAKEQLSGAETALRKTQESTGLISLDHQGRAIIESLARVRAEIAASEVALQAMSTFAAAQNPDRLRLEQQLVGLKAQLLKLERAEQSGGGVFLPSSKVPAAGLEYIRHLRDVKYYETIFELLAKQFEIAKIDEAKEALVVQLVDRAVPADRKLKPKRLLIAVLAAVAALVVTLLAVVVAERVGRPRAAAAYPRR
jgi:tyrosine-protein kinase Etk/Wzc